MWLAEGIRDRRVLAAFRGVPRALFVPAEAVGQAFVGGQKEARGTAALPANTWTHLATTYDGSALRLYLNGTQVRTLAVSGAMTVSTGPLSLGGNAIWTDWFAGLMDDVRVSNRALTPAEIESDMNAPVVLPM